MKITVFPCKNNVSVVPNAKRQPRIGRNVVIVLSLKEVNKMFPRRSSWGFFLSLTASRPPCYQNRQPFCCRSQLFFTNRGLLILVFIFQPFLRHKVFWFYLHFRQKQKRFHSRTKTEQNWAEHHNKVTLFGIVHVALEHLCARWSARARVPETVHAPLWFQFRQGWKRCYTWAAKKTFHEPTSRQRRPHKKGGRNSFIPKWVCALS